MYKVFRKGSDDARNVTSKGHGKDFQKLSQKLSKKQQLKEIKVTTSITNQVSTDILLKEKLIITSKDKLIDVQERYQHAGPIDVPCQAAHFLTK